MQPNKLKTYMLIFISLSFPGSMISQEKEEGNPGPQLPNIELSIEDAIQLVLQKKPDFASGSL